MHSPAAKDSVSIHVNHTIYNTKSIVTIYVRESQTTFYSTCVYVDPIDKTVGNSSLVIYQ